MKPVRKLAGDFHVSVAVELALADVGPGRLDAEDLLGVFLVGDAEIDRVASGPLITSCAFAGVQSFLR